MEPQELQEHAEQAHERGQKSIGLTTAIVAVLLAVSTMLGNRTHVEEGKLQTKITDEWSFYNSKHSLAHTFTADIQQAELSGSIGRILARHLSIPSKERERVAEEILKTAEAQAGKYRGNEEKEDRDSQQIKKNAEDMEHQAELLSHSGDVYTISELFLQISIVLCSVALLAESRLFWKMSFLSTLAGVGLVVYGLLLR